MKYLRIYRSGNIPPIRIGNITPQALCYRANGNLEHTDFERKGIEETFTNYGIKEPWGLA